MALQFLSIKCPCPRSDTRDFRLARRKHKRKASEAITRSTISKLTILAVSGVAGGCAIWDGNRTVRRASIVEFLYPNKERPLEKPSVLVLSLLMDVGVVLVPESLAGGEVVLTEKQNVQWMEQVAEQFKQYPFIRSVNLIPTLYLRPGPVHLAGAACGVAHGGLRR